jgi:hypothetical protein
MSYNSVLMKRKRRCVNQDGSWRRVNKDLAMMNHASEKSNHEAWCQGTGCDGEEQVYVESDGSS